jgi:hypothetical protein
MLLLRGKDENQDIENLGSVLRDGSIQTLRLPTFSANLSITFALFVPQSGRTIGSSRQEASVALFVLKLRFPFSPEALAQNSCAFRNPTLAGAEVPLGSPPALIALEKLGLRSRSRMMQTADAGEGPTRVFG